MKITKRQLKRIIKEEKVKLLNEIQQTSDPRQQTLNQGEVDQVDALVISWEKNPIPLLVAVHHLMIKLHE